MTQILVAEVEIIGTRPLLYHCFKTDVLTGRRPKSGTKGNDPKEWQTSYLANEKGQFYLEPSYIFGCLRDAARLTKDGRSSYQKTVASTLQVINNRILIDKFMPKTELTTNPEELVYLDIRTVRNPNTNGKNVRYRVALKEGWKAKFSILWDQSILAPEIMNAICIDAGAFTGLGDGRSIGFGRFNVLQFEVNKFAKETSA